MHCCDFALESFVVHGKVDTRFLRKQEKVLCDVMANARFVFFSLPSSSW